MAETIPVQIGSETVEVPLVLTFAQLERIWPAFLLLGQKLDRAQQISACAAIISNALHETRPDVTVAWIKHRLLIDRYRLKNDQLPGLTAAVDRLLIESGVIEDKPPGEPEPAAPPPPPASP